MWLLENENAFGGRQLWLRPGKTYLFGRTAAEPGQLEISHNTISRKHLTISVHDVEPGHAHDLSSRSRLTIEDLATKIGTTVDGSKIKGDKITVEKDETQIIMGKCPHIFRLTWHSVVFTFSFTNKELQKQPLTLLRDRFEQLDIKLLTDYNVQHTTHVVSKKRNTAKGLQALINARHIVTESFLDAVVDAAGPSDDESAGGASRLEQDFRKWWPDASQHLPPRGGEPVQHPDSIYRPDHGRKAIFAGYTFIFYDQTQYNTLLAPITNGDGKALLHIVNPGSTSTDDFVRYVKSVAGEKGLGSFEDGSEGKGVVLVRYLPAKGEQLAWFTDFLTSVSLQLDHRPIEQSEFLEAILTKSAGILRRPLELEPSQSHSPPAPNGLVAFQAQKANSRGTAHDRPPTESSQPSLPRKGARRVVKRRFAGFASDDDESILDASIPSAQDQNPIHHEEEGLFVSQDQSYPEESQPVIRRRGSDLLDGMAEGSERYKRQKVAHIINSKSASPEPEREMPASEPPKKTKRSYNVMEMAAKRKDAEEARARAEEEDLATLPDGIDLAEIRKLNIVEEMPLRQSTTVSKTRDQDIADGRWKPEWNGMQNFKKFRKRGAAMGRAPARVIVSLTQVKPKEFGLGDDYWLEDETTQKQGLRPSSERDISRSQQSTKPSVPSKQTRVLNDSDDDDGHNVDDSDLLGRADEEVTVQPATNITKSTRKRPATAPVSAMPSRSSKRPKQGHSRIEIRDSDGSADSDDDIAFRFGRRR
ncbi:hypothetical protein NLU13_1156 [Sarocladium strictum]|uniref:FHA domain-containing protein n=1 Tax=Sarocladium strictum TaxID=5046 RepID=A0AA39GQF4_SARSR|nr:hypothetical protein NLU13_1156 [Sarocladium strictum]